jgi:predicted DNA-binding ArsR family transcriptional regulator
MPNTKVEELQRLQKELEETEDLIATTSDRLNSQIQMRRSIAKRISELSQQVQKESLFSSVRADGIA